MGGCCRNISREIHVETIAAAHFVKNCRLPSENCESFEVNTKMLTSLALYNTHFNLELSPVKGNDTILNAGTMKRFK